MKQYLFIIDGNKPLLQQGIINIINKQLTNYILFTQTSINKNPFLLIICVDKLSCSKHYLSKYQQYTNLHKIILYSQHNKDLDLSTYLELDCQCIIKDTLISQDLINCIRLLQHNIFFTDKDLTKLLLEKLKSYNTINKLIAFTDNKIKPTTREIIIAKLILHGFDNKAIAQELNLSSGTIKNIISLILEKYNFHTRSQIISLLFIS